MQASPPESARRIERSLRKASAQDSTFQQRLYFWSQRTYFWGLRVRGAVMSCFGLALLYVLWGNAVRSLASAQSMAVLTAWASATLASLQIIKHEGSNSILIPGSLAYLPVPDARVWRRYLFASSTESLVMLPALLISCGCLAEQINAPLHVKISLFFVMSFLQLVLTLLIVEIALRFRRVANWDGWVHILLGSLFGLIMLIFNLQVFEQLVDAIALKVSWFWPAAWPALIVAKPPQGWSVLDCGLVFAVLSVLLALLFLLLTIRGARRYRIGEVLPWDEQTYAYGFSPWFHTQANLIAYEAWCDDLLYENTLAADNGDTDGQQATVGSAASTLDSVTDDTDEENLEGIGTSEDWLAAEHELDEDRWRKARSTYPLKYLSERERDIIRVRCINADNVHQPRWTEVLWKALVLSVFLALMPQMAQPYAGPFLAWLLFGQTLSSVFAQGFIRIRQLPYTAEHIIAAEMKYRLLVAASLAVPIVPATILVGQHFGLSVLQCIDMSVRVALVLALAIVLFLFVSLIERTQPRLIHLRSLFRSLWLIATAVVAAVGAIVTLVEFGWVAYAGAVAALIGTKMFYHAILNLYYARELDFVEQQLDRNA